MLARSSHNPPVSPASTAHKNQYLIFPLAVMLVRGTRAHAPAKPRRQNARRVHFLRAAALCTRTARVRSPSSCSTARVRGTATLSPQPPPLRFAVSMVRCVRRALQEKASPPPHPSHCFISLSLSVTRTQQVNRVVAVLALVSCGRFSRVCSCFRFQRPRLSRARALPVFAFFESDLPTQGEQQRRCSTQSHTHTHTNTHIGGERYISCREEPAPQTH